MCDDITVNKTCRVHYYNSISFFPLLSQYQIVKTLNAYEQSYERVLVVGGDKSCIAISVERQILAVF